MSMKNIEYTLNTFFIFTDLYPAVLLGRKVLPVILMWITMPVKLDVLYQIILLSFGMGFYRVTATEVKNTRCPSSRIYQQIQIILRKTCITIIFLDF